MASTHQTFKFGIAARTCLLIAGRVSLVKQRWRTMICSLCPTATSKVGRIPYIPVDSTTVSPGAALLTDDGRDDEKGGPLPSEVAERCQTDQPYKYISFVSDNRRHCRASIAFGIAYKAFVKDRS